MRSDASSGNLNLYGCTVNVAARRTQRRPGVLAAGSTPWICGAAQFGGLSRAARHIRRAVALLRGRYPRLLGDFADSAKGCKVQPAGCGFCVTRRALLAAGSTPWIGDAAPSGGLSRGCEHIRRAVASRRTDRRPNRPTPGTSGNRPQKRGHPSDPFLFTHTTA
jgi:hypothetical protein